MSKRIRVIVQTIKPMYVPSEIQLRTRIDETMFTGEMLESDLAIVSTNIDIKSIGVANKLRLMDEDKSRERDELLKALTPFANAVDDGAPEYTPNPNKVDRDDWIRAKLLIDRIKNE